MTTKIMPGTRVSGGEGDDYDIGTVREATGTDAEHVMARGPNVWVRWDSGVATWMPIADLKRL